MDRIFSELIERCEECVTLAKSLARNASYDKDIESNSKARLQDLCTMVGEVRTLILYEVYCQISNEPWDIDIDITI